MKLEYERSFSIKHKKQGLNEPSGLTIAPDGTLWTVSDDTEKLFHLDQQGELLGWIKAKHQDLEGIAIDPAGHLWTVAEGSGRILIYDSTSGEKIDSRRIRDIEGYDAIQPYFKRVKNDGLEGIAFDPIRSEILLLKESKPGLLIAVDHRLRNLVSVERLDKTRGFRDENLESKQLDFSGICYDAKRDLFWIVSDRGQRVFAYDRRTGKVPFSFSLSLENEDREIKKAEGISLDRDSQRLYVVSDKKARLYVYRVNEV